MIRHPINGNPKIMATPKKSDLRLLVVTRELCALIQDRKVSLRWLAKDKNKESYREVENIEIRIDSLIGDVEKDLLEKRKARPDIANIFSAFSTAGIFCPDVLERLIDERNDNDTKITGADPANDYAQLLTTDEEISNRIELIALAAIEELQQYEG